MPGRPRDPHSRPRARRAPSESSMSSRSPSPRRYRSRPRRRYSSRRRSSSRDSVIAPLPEDKPFYKKKTLWATLASAATVIAVMPTWRSANASRSSANASHRSANASERSAEGSMRSARAVEKSLQYSERSANAAMRSAEASLRSARAVERSTKAVERSARAVTNTAVAGGHMDHDGNYLGPPPGTGPKKQEVVETRGSEIERGRSERRESGSRTSRARVEDRKGMKQIEYEPLSQFLGAASLPAAVPVRV